MTTSLEEKLRGIIQHAYDHTQAVKAIFDQAGLVPDDVQALENLDKVPVTSKDHLVELQQECRSERQRPRGTRRGCCTPGET